MVSEKRLVVGSCAPLIKPGGSQTRGMGKSPSFGVQDSGWALDKDGKTSEKLETVAKALHGQQSLLPHSFH